MSNIVRTVGRRVRELRIRAGMTQERLAERSRISVSFLSMIERGERSPHLETLERLSLGLEVQVEELFRTDGSDFIREASKSTPPEEPEADGPDESFAEVAPAPRGRRSG